jgi:outer membrane protein
MNYFRIFGFLLSTGLFVTAHSIEASSCSRLADKMPPYLECVAEEEEPCFCTMAGDWFTRLRALYVMPYDSSGALSTIPDSGVSVHPAWTGEFDFGYMFTQNLGFELILSTTKHTLMGTKSLEGIEIGTTWLLPPTFTLQWRFMPSYRIQPYLGAGVNYTLFYWNNCDLPDTHMNLSHSWGAALQGGVDLFFYKDWLFNLDVKYVWIDTDATLTGLIPGKVHVDINPWLFGFGIGRKW